MDAVDSGLCGSMGFRIVSTVIRRVCCGRRDWHGETYQSQIINAIPERSHQMMDVDTALTLIQDDESLAS